ncbi:helix-turn-helix domain-containing protein [Massilia sp. YIM B02787]|uniref:Helix-turn-helix domain-containing protein n=1 Tax=Massilia orientalis TaxID=3050128 RepID=A0ACC7MKN8_9BURK|nr:helix-turn-helix domain-containing protein [Massilia sp. YIM B02787]
MQNFYKKALYALLLLLLADALIACLCVYQSYPSAALMPPGGGGLYWRPVTKTDAPEGGTSTIRVIETAQRSLRFDFRLTRATTYPFVSADMLFEDGEGNAVPVDLSRFDTITFTAKCNPMNALIFALPTFDATISKAGDYLTYPSPLTFFSCNEKGTPVSLDLTRLTIPQWWYDRMHLDLSHQSYQLNQVAKFVFGVSQQTPRDRDSRVEISGVTLHGRDYRYLVALAIILVSSWCAFAFWFFRAHSRELSASLDTKLRKDLPLVAYRQLTLEPFKDKEKAAVLRFIATNYTNPDLDLDSVVAGTGANRNKVNEVLKGELGMTFTAYLKKLRLTESARLLTEAPAVTVAEVAYSVGYANVSYFNKLFKEEYGCTPKVFKTVASTAQQEQHDS